MTAANIWIKICGNTSLGADALGFVFAPSPRRVTPAQVAAIVPHLPAAIEKIGVFVDVSFNEIESTVRTTRITGVQLHFDAAPDLPAKLRAHFGPELRILRVIHFAGGPGEEAAAIMQDPNLDAVLVDSRTATSVGGTGQAFDWAAASKSLFQNAAERKLRLVAAGGLSPDNIADAIATLQPWGVDVVSGVESAPGRKDPAKVRAFFASARAAK
jgi:phosphoribosylanthranilate isomerase